VVFALDERKKFTTQVELFRFCDTNHSGQLDLHLFSTAVTELRHLCPSVGSLEQEWEMSRGSALGHVNFKNFCAWTTSHGLEFPVGVDTSTDSDEPCRFRLEDGVTICPCNRFVPGKQGTFCKECLHRKSCHRSDAADLSFAEWLHRPGPKHWVEGESGLVVVRDNETLGRLQTLMTATHKETDNWDRDRGCAIHGVHSAKCRKACMWKNKEKVPTGYQLLWAMRNQNQDMWNTYTLMKESMRVEVADTELECFPMLTSPFVPICAETLDVDFNEWCLFHGASHTALTSICTTGFDISRAGTGATWKPATGAVTGSPLYGYGAYFAERITKADSYSHALPGHSGEEPEDHFCVLLCRAVGGRVRAEYEDEIDKEALRQSVFQGSNHSVLGDRVRVLKKPYREVVMYDKTQVYPEYILYYKRLYDGSTPLPPAEYGFCLETPSGRPVPSRSITEGAEPAFRQGQLVDYHSDSRKCWFFTRILSIRKSGAVDVAVKPGSLLPREEQVPSKIRLHVPPSKCDVGALGQYVEYRGSSGLWVPGIVVRVTDDGALGLDNPNAEEIPQADISLKLRLRQTRFAVGDHVEYVSKNYGKLEAFITAVDPSGAVQINVKPDHWITLDEQREKMAITMMHL